MKPKEVRELDAQMAHQMWLAITKIEAREILNQIMVVSYPNLKPEDRKRISRTVEAQGKIEETKKKPEMSNDDLAKWLRSALG